MYRTAWTGSMMLAGAVGLWVAVLKWSVGAVALFLFLAAIAFCIRLTMNEEKQPNWRRATTVGLVWGAGALAALGLMVWLGLKGFALIALLTVTCPAVMARVSTHVLGSPRGQEAVASAEPCSRGDRTAPDRHDAARHGTQPAVRTSPSFPDAAWMSQPVGSMDDGSLCFAWRTSYVALQQALPAHRRARIVQRRQEFLDELARRNPHGFQAWLDSGARAAGDPTRYIAAAHRPVHRHDRH